MALNEKILVCELKKGNIKAYEHLFFLFHRKLYNFCYRITGNTQESEDLTQEVFISIWNNRHKLDENRSFSGFVFRIARNKALNVIKRELSKMLYVQYLNNEEPVKWNPDIEKTELMHLLNSSISSLAEKTREIFLLSREECMTYREIAEKLNITENVVDHEIRKALKKIKEFLSSKDYM